MVSMAVAIAPFLMPTAIAFLLMSTIFLPLVLFRTVALVTSDVLSMFPAASSQRHQHGQNQRRRQ